MSLSFLESVKFCEEVNLNISVDPKFRKLHDKFKHDPSEKHYDNLISYLRNVVNDVKEGKFTLVYSDDKSKPVFNSSLKDNKHGNSYKNYLNGNIKFDDKYQKRSANKSDKQVINVTFHYDKVAHHKYKRYLYVSNYVGSVITSSLGVDQITSESTCKYTNLC